MEGLKRPGELGPKLWGEGVPYTPIKFRKWSQYIASAANLIKTDTTLEKAAWDLVNNRHAHFMKTMPPRAFVEVNTIAAAAASYRLGRDFFVSLLTTFSVADVHRSTSGSGKSCTRG